MPIGGLAQFTVVDQSKVALRPEGMSVLTAAACPTSAVTGLYFVRERARVKQGDRVLVLGGSGGVGSAIVQLAR